MGLGQLPLVGGRAQHAKSLPRPALQDSRQPQMDAEAGRHQGIQQPDVQVHYQQVVEDSAGPAAQVHSAVLGVSRGARRSRDLSLL